MMILMSGKHFRRVLILMALLFLFAGTVPVFSQQILASYGVGIQSVEYWDDNDEYYDEFSLTLGVNVLFVGRTGFTISTEIGFNADSDLFVDPVLGLGYVYYDVLYLGGILNVIPSQLHDVVILAPTVVGGFDFGSFLLQAQLSYMLGFSAGSGFRFSIGAGVNVGNFRR